MARSAVSFLGAVGVLGTPVAEQRRVLLMLDGLDALADMDAARDLGWLQSVRDLPPDRVRVIVSVTDGLTAAQVLGGRGQQLHGCLADWFAPT
jgi:hypothetical protein